MLTLLRTCLLCLLLAMGNAALSQPASNFSKDGVKQCLGCHDFGPESPVHAVISGSHGTEGDPASMAGRRGCEDCHGPSASHTKAPTQNAPGVSFGPRWTATSAAQDGQCLACHEGDIASHWQDALHMINNLTCVTCHDIHAEQDRVLFEDQQASVCTVCHKAQKKGIHGMQRRAARNPPCTQCHNPHDHESAEAQMQKNQSAGCSHCHDLVRMADSKRVSDKAKNYHKVMARPGRTCIGCHQDIAHVPTDSISALHTTPVQGRQVTLFYPGIADSGWLLQQHPGSQPLRQGASCQRCHRGEEASLGESRGGDIEPKAREFSVSFSRHEEQLQITLEWPGPADDSNLSLMWAENGNDAFRRGGCFAACHSDMPGMSQDRGQQTQKYLGISRAQRQRLGQPSIVKDEAALEELVAQGNFAEIWRVGLQSSTVETSLLLSGVDWQPTKLIWINKSYNDGRWRVVLRRSMYDTGKGINFIPENKYTFGIALNGADNPDGRHWVSLPMSLSFGGDDTDFTAE